MHRMARYMTITVALLVGSAIAVTQLVAAPSRIVVEGEHYAWLKASMAEATSQVASNGAYVHIPLLRPHGVDESGPSDEGSATYKVYIPTAGKWYLWARCHWWDDCGNSFFVMVDKLDVDTPPQITDSTLQKWHWVKGRSYQLTEGYHLMRFQNREDGAKLDQFLLTRTPSNRWRPTRKYSETSSYVWRPAEEEQ